MSVSIKFPCGCEINETHVIAMCIPHDVELREKRLEREKAQREMYDRFLGGLDRTIRGGKTS